MLSNLLNLVYTFLSSFGSTDLFILPMSMLFVVLAVRITYSIFKGEY